MHKSQANDAGRMPALRQAGRPAGATVQRNSRDDSRHGGDIPCVDAEMLDSCALTQYVLVLENESKYHKIGIDDVAADA